MKIIIDRFEGDLVVVETPEKKMLDMPRELLPLGAKEGDVLCISIDLEATQERKKTIDSLLKDLWE